MTKLAITKGLTNPTLKILDDGEFDSVCKFQGRELTVSRTGNRETFKMNKAFYCLSGNFPQEVGEDIPRKDVPFTTRQMVVLDFDEGFTKPLELEDVIAKLSKMGLQFIISPTPSYKPNAERYRLFMPLDEPCPREIYSQVCTAIAKKLDIGELDEGSNNPTQLQGVPVKVTLPDNTVLEPFYHPQGRPIELAKFKPSVTPLKTAPLALHHASGELMSDAFKMQLSAYHERMREQLYEPSYDGMWFSTLLSIVATYQGGRINAYEAHEIIQRLWCEDARLVDANITKFNQNKDKNIRMTKHIDEWITLDSTQVDSQVKQTASASLHLDMDKQGRVKGTQENYERIIRALYPKLMFEGYTERIQTSGEIDLRDNENEIKIPRTNVYPKGFSLSKAHFRKMMIYAQRKYGTFPIHMDEIVDAFHAIAYEDTQHQIITNLERIEWDGVSRLDTYLIDNLNATDNAFVREITRKTIVAMVMRAYKHGIKFEVLPILIGAQGGGKSTIFASLVYAVTGNDDLYNDSLKMGDNGKDAMLGFNDSWVVEYSELRAVSGFTIDDMKTMITQTKDKFRKPYAEDVSNNPRKCIMIGTTNELPQHLLNDPSGSRRWAIIECNKSRNDYKPSDVPLHESKEGLEYLRQVMAEATHIAKMNLSAIEDGMLHTIPIENRVDKLSPTSISYQDNMNELYQDDPEHIERVKIFVNMTVPSNWDSMGLTDKQYFFENVLDNPKARMQAYQSKVDGFTLRDVIQVACQGVKLGGGTVINPQNKGGQEIGRWLLANDFERDTDRSKQTRQTKYYRTN